MLVASGLLTSPPVPARQAAATAPQNHEIFLAPFKDGEGRTIRLAFLGIQMHGFTVDRPRSITNHAGDDDQPCFLPDSSGVLFSSRRDGRQRDIYRYDISTKAVTRITNSREDEQSPMMTPDGRTFSAVRGAQQLWRLNPDGSRCRIRRDPCRAHSELRLGVTGEDCPMGARRPRRRNTCAHGPRVGHIGSHGVERRAIPPAAASHRSVDVRVHDHAPGIGRSRRSIPRRGKSAPTPRPSTVATRWRGRPATDCSWLRAGSCSSVKTRRIDGLRTPISARPG